MLLKDSKHDSLGVDITKCNRNRMYGTKYKQKMYDLKIKEDRRKGLQ